MALSLLALDPWWYGQTQSAAIGIASPTAFDAAIPFDDAIPFDGGAATVVTVDGDEAAFPVFSVVGPFTTLAVSDGTSTWELAAALGSGETLLIDSRPASRGPGHRDRRHGLVAAVGGVAAVDAADRHVFDHRRLVRVRVGVVGDGDVGDEVAHTMTVNLGDFDAVRPTVSSNELTTGARTLVCMTDTPNTPGPRPTRSSSPRSLPTRSAPTPSSRRRPRTLRTTSRPS